MALCLLIAGIEVEAYAIRFEHSDLLLAYVRASMMMGQPIADEQDELISQDSTSTSPLPLSGIFLPKDNIAENMGRINIARIHFLPDIPLHCNLIQHFLKYEKLKVSMIYPPRVEISYQWMIISH